MNFIESVQRDVEAGVLLSPKQRELAEQLARKMGRAVTLRPERPTT